MEKNKKTKYIIITLAFVILVYFNYFRDERKIEVRENVIQTTGVTYTDSEYTINADKQSDFLDRNETMFERAKAQIRELVLTSDNAFLDKAKNLVLKSNIFGIAPNGWSFTADEINYDKELGKIVSTTGIRAKNKDRGIEVLSDEFYTDSRMSFIDLYKNVTIIGDKFIVTGDEAHYNDKNKIATMSNNITLLARNSDITKDDTVANPQNKATSGLAKNVTGELTGKFQKIVYDMAKGIMTTDVEYTLTSSDSVLKAEQFIYNQKENTMKIFQNVRMQIGEFKIGIDRIEKFPENEYFDIFGPITGASPERTFTAESGIYSPEKKELTLIGNVKITGKNGDTLLADRVVYNSVTKDIVAYGDGRDVSYTGADGQQFQSKRIKYNSETKIVTIKDKFRFKNSEYEGTGEYLVYKSLTREGEYYGIKATNSVNTIETSIILHHGEQGKIVLPETYTVTQNEKGSVFKSKNTVYNMVTRTISTEEEFVYTAGGDIVTGKGGTYNTETQEGVIYSKIRMENKERGEVIEGNKGEIKSGKHLTLSQGVTINSKQYTTEVSRADYNFIEQLFKIDEPVKIKSLDGKTVIDIVNPVINTEKRIITGSNFVGVGEEYKANSDKVEYRYDNEFLILTGNARVEQKGIVSTGNRIEYSAKTGEIKSSGPYAVKNDTWKVEGLNISIINSTGAITGGKVTATSINNQRFQGNRVEGNINSKVSFIGNTSGQHMGADGKLITYTGERVDVHFRKNKNGQGSQATQLDLLQRSVLKSENATLYSNRISVDLEKNIATAFDRPRVVISDAKNGNSEILVDTMELHQSEEIINLFGNVVVNNTNDKNEKIVATADNGRVRLKDKVIELTGNVIVESPTAFLYADRAEYDTVTKKIRAFGRTRVDYKKVK